MRSSARSRVVVVALASMFAVAGCGSTGTSTDSSTTEARTEVGGSAPAGADGGTPAGGVSESPADGGPGDSGSSGGDTPSAPPKPAKPSATGGATSNGGPEIVYFRVQQQPSCPAGTNVNPIPGNPVVVEWKATNVDRVALSVDGPGIYADSYAPTGSETLNFPCEGDEGDTQKHTYQLTVSNATGKQTRTITVSARVNGIAPV